MAYFRRLDEQTYQPTSHVGGAWVTDEQHIAPTFGLLTHVIEQQRGGDLQVARLSFDILGVLPLTPMEVSLEVLRPGRTIELVEATVTQGGRAAVRGRAWLLSRQDSDAVQGSPIEPLPAPAEVPAWDPTTVWPGGFIDSIELRRDQRAPGDADFWARTPHELIDGEQVSPLARLVGLFDIANGMTVREDPREVRFPNLDLTAHLFRHPVGEWLGFRTTVSFGESGLGVTSSVLHDETGPFGTLAQSLTVRP